MEQPAIELQLSDDGSHTIFLPEIDEHYHSTRGALQEALFVYIERGLRAFEAQQATVLEIGFGTGLNAFLSAIEAIETNRTLRYVSYEKFPLSAEIIAQLNYAQIISPQHSALFQAIHAAPWNKEVAITPQFSLHKIHSDITLLAPMHLCNVIYYDAFAPSKQAEMWSEKLLAHVCSHLQTRGVFVTYCAQGKLRRTLQTLGLQVERLPGPPGKWEMLRAHASKHSKMLCRSHCQSLRKSANSRTKCEFLGVMDK